MTYQVNEVHSNRDAVPSDRPVFVAQDGQFFYFMNERPDYSDDFQVNPTMNFVEAPFDCDFTVEKAMLARNWLITEYASTTLIFV